MRHLQPQRTTHLKVGSRIPIVIAIACFVAITGCGEPIGPRTICCVSHQPPETVSGLAVLAAELHDAADVFDEGVADTTVRSQAQSAINSLADQLLAGKVAGSRAALAQARSLLANLDVVSTTELTPVSFALDYIERRVNEILIASGYRG